MLGAVLREARLAAELTQEQLAFRAGIDRTYVSQLEHDKKSPTLAILFRLADALDILASEIIAKVEERRRKRK